MNKFVTNYPAKKDLAVITETAIEAMLEQTKIMNSLVDILIAYKNKKSLLSNQGQGLDGYSALANFVSVAEKAMLLLGREEEKEEAL